MGPNGSGKSTLSYIVSKKPKYKMEEGNIIFEKKSLSQFLPEELSRKGIFLGFQHPISIPGLNNAQFLKTSVNSIRKHQGKKIYDSFTFLKKVKKYMKILNMKEELLYRSLNDGFSGGEKKCNEILQMMMMKPTLIFLDEIDSGLDIDALKNISKGINLMRNLNTSIVLITHYQRLLNYVEPNFVHIMYDGKIIRSGDKNLVLYIEQNGFKDIIKKNKVL
jgi:Fe-S cluster assembly ATP-binding protein